MDIKDFLAPSGVFVDVPASNKTGLLEDLCVRAASILKVNADKITTAILEREKLGSTGVGHGVAIPHARIADVTKPFGLLARLRYAIDFGVIDQPPVDIVFMLLLPTALTGERVSALAVVARRLRDDDITHNLRSAAHASDLYEAMIRSLS
jgi:PTS system nitrogen regulatory IIA component